jgi:putative ABC transport system permease protein
MADLFNFDLLQSEVPVLSLVAQIVVGLLAPMLASLYPFLTGLKVTAAEAMGAYQTGRNTFGGGAIDCLLSGANLWFARHTVMRPVLLSLRNVFRSKGRLLMTLATLSCAGAIFCGVFSVRASLSRTLDDLLGWWNYDVTVILGRPYRARRLERETRQVPGVAETDVWLQLAIRRVRADGSESGPVMLFAPYADSRLVTPPTIVEGRWLVPEDQNALVVNSILLQEEPDLRVGDDVTFKTDGREHEYRIVGICMGILAPMAYANYPYISYLTGQAGQAGAVLVATREHDLAAVSETATLLEERFDRVGLHVADVQMISIERAEAEALFGIVVALLMIMAALLALVGGLGLMGTMSINVIERTREIGVLRAIGASNRGVAWVFVREGITIGLLSWVIGALLSWPLGRMLSDAVGTPIIGTALSFSYSLLGVWLWLGLVVLLSALASLLPARRASRLTVRQVLAYE